MADSGLMDELKWKKFSALDKGFVCLVDKMGDDAAVAEAARTSYGAGTKKVSDDRGLIRYLMRKYHTTPFEMVELKFMVYVPMDCWRQWIRHRTASVNEYSTRYSEAIDDKQETDELEWRLQSGGNKQGSFGYLDEWPEGWEFNELEGAVYPAEGCEHTKIAYGAGINTPGKLLTQMEKDFHRNAQRIYNTRLELGVAREQARKDLPLSTYTKAYWKCNLHNLLHFLRLRMDGHAQQEIREYATIIGEQIVKPLFPVTWEAFEDYRLYAMTFSGPEVELLQELLEHHLAYSDAQIQSLVSKMENKRERSEFLEKLARLGNRVKAES